jgi:UDP-N-acetylmuramate dehydrogenase
MKTNINLQPYNSFGFNATAKYFVDINDTKELDRLFKTPEYKNEKHLILSGGNNILLTKEFFDGIVILMNNKGIKTVADEGNQVIVRAQAGEDWPEFVKKMVEKGLYGVENLAHIPGKVGAAPVQNIGAYGMELKDSFLKCEAVNLETGRKRVFDNKECVFGYRSSIFKTMLRGQYVITSVDFRLTKNAELKLEYGNIRSYLSEQGINEPSLQQLHDAICAIRDAKLPDPKAIGNAGSFFKNPVIKAEQFEILQQQYPEMPHYDEPNGKVKVPAGWLIEQAGWKGWHDEHVGVYEKQALVLVHYGGGSGNDIVTLAQRIQASVKEKFGITINPEVNFI